MRPRRRWVQFSLGTMLLLVTALAIWLGWELRYIRQRQANIREIEQLGGYAVTVADEGKTSRPLKFKAKVPVWRLWLGDKAVARFRIPDGADKVLGDYQSLFPEADKPHYFYPVTGPFAPKPPSSASQN